MRSKLLLTAVLTLTALATTGCTDLLADPPPTTAAQETFERKRKAEPTPDKIANEVKTEAKPAATADDIRAIFREEVPKSLEPVVRQVNQLTKKTAALEETVAALQANADRLEGDTGRALAAFRSELGDLRRGFVQLGTAVSELKTKSEEADKKPPAEDVQAVHKALAKLAAKVDALTERVSGYTSARQPDPPPAPPTPSTKKSVILPCGFRIDQMDVPDGGVYVRCSKCGGLSFVK